VNVAQNAYKKANRHIYTAAQGRRRAKQAAATAQGEWADFDLKEIYACARLRSDITKVPHEVDHIVPLNHDKVCGLHAPQNLQVIPEADNMAKSNKYEVA
jgi:5-methylcytosine-specific restriction endonuclease McrA